MAGKNRMVFLLGMMASFNMFVGGGVGTFINGKVLDIWGLEPVFIIASGLILLAGIFGALLLRRTAGPGGSRS